MEIAGLPLHFLVIHAAVVFTPLAAVSAATFALVPRWRWLTRWPTAALAVVALGSVATAVLSGNSYLNAHRQLEPIVATHKSRGTLLLWAMVVFAVLVLVAVRYLASVTPLASGRGARSSPRPSLERPLVVAVVLVALVVLALVVLTGDAGSRAVWGG